ncbi:MAG: hypothetical protein AABM29_11155 [Actinomycetota bacterium]
MSPRTISNLLLAGLVVLAGVAAWVLNVVDASGGVSALVAVALFALAGQHAFWHEGHVPRKRPDH